MEVVLVKIERKALAKNLDKRVVTHLAKEAIALIKQVEADAVALIAEAQEQTKATILQVTEEVAAYEAKVKQETAATIDQEKNHVQQEIQEATEQMTLQGDQMKEELLTMSKKNVEKAVQTVIERIVK